MQLVDALAEVLVDALAEADELV
ncbi:MAG: hypothetical protein JWO63_2552, partial [Frankiales bacterium]|nr:hypothetical protein [Frankiales bacterium]